MSPIITKATAIWITVLSYPFKSWNNRTNDISFVFQVFSQIRRNWDSILALGTLEKKSSKKSSLQYDYRFLGLLPLEVTVFFTATKVSRILMPIFTTLTTSRYLLKTRTCSFTTMTKIKSPPKRSYRHSEWIILGLTKRYLQRSGLRKIVNNSGVFWSYLQKADSSVFYTTARFRVDKLQHKSYQPEYLGYEHTPKSTLNLNNLNSKKILKILFYYEKCILDIP